MRSERGQASVEWTGLMLLLAAALAAALAFVPHVDGRSLGGLLAHRMLCAARGGCDDGGPELAAAYGAEDAALVRAYAPGIAYEPGTLTLPIDFRRCRDHRCSDAADDRDADVHSALRGGAPATAFTHLARSGGETFIQYWLYYPDSTTGGPAKALWDAHPATRGTSYPGFHRDDWESFQVRLDAAGRPTARSSSHHGYRSCKARSCQGEWGPATGWTRVSRGSHAGHVPLRRRRGPLGGLPRHAPIYPGVDLRERTSTASALRLVPLEAIDPGAYRPLDRGISPPWRKRVYVDPRSDSTG